MFHLVKDNVEKIENNLLWVKSVRDSAFSWWFNILILLGVLMSFSYFLYSSYGTVPSEELKEITFEPRLWNNAVRNVPISNYGQTPEIETGELGPDVVMPLIENMKIAMAAWLVGNRPEGRMPNEFVPIAYNSGEIYE